MSSTLRRAFAGLEAGVLGALLMIGWLMLGSAWSRRSVWIIPNLFATTFYGPNAYGNLFLRSSWSGIALLVAIYSFGGVLWSILWGAFRGDERKPFIVLFGVLTGLAVYFVFFDVIWKYENPLITLYAPDGRMQMAHVLWGMVLARSPEYSRKIALGFSNTLPEAHEAEDVRSGEVIL